MNPNIFRTTGCTCSKDGDLRAAIERRPRSLCPVHQPDEIAQREIDVRREAASAAYVEASAIHDLMREAIAPAGPECRCPSVAAGLRRLLAGEQLEPCPLHQPTAPAGSNVALNDDNALARIVGLPMGRSVHNSPPDAA